jgi:hypothetical protein
MITVDSIKDIGSEANQLLKNTDGNNGRALRRFLGRQCQHNKIFQTIASTNGLWPRQIKAIIEAAEGQAMVLEYIGVVRGPVTLDKATGDIAVTFDVPHPIETASVREMRTIVQAIETICRYAEAFRDQNLNRCILGSAKCPDYEYRGYPCSVVEDPWYVGGQDLRGGSGVLEWCTSESDAQDRLAMMKKHKRFVHLGIESWAAEQERLGRSQNVA